MAKTVSPASLVYLPVERRPSMATRWPLSVYSATFSASLPKQVIGM